MGLVRMNNALDVDFRKRGYKPVTCVFRATHPQFDKPFTVGRFVFSDNTEIGKQISRTTDALNGKLRGNEFVLTVYREEDEYDD